VCTVLRSAAATSFASPAPARREGSSKASRICRLTRSGQLAKAERSFVRHSGRAVIKRQLPIAVAFLLLGALALAGNESALAPAPVSAQAKAVSGQRAPSAPRTLTKATKLIRQSATQLAKDYSKGRAKAVCAGLTAKALKSLGGNKSCALKVRSVAKLKRISKINIKTLVFRRNRASVNVSGYLNDKRKQRLSVAFKWERGRYRLDHSITSLSGLFK